MVRLSKEQELLIADKLLDTANLTLAVLLFGQIAGEKPFSWMLALAGFVVWSMLLAFSVWVIRWTNAG
jgi:hypothetical protein